MRTSTLEARSKGGLVTAERRRARAERDEAIDDAVTGHIGKLSAIMGRLVDDASGEQYRCTGGVLGPKVPKLALREAADVLRLLMAAVKKPVAFAPSRCGGYCGRSFLIFRRSMVVPC